MYVCVCERVMVRFRVMVHAFVCWGVGEGGGIWHAALLAEIWALKRREKHGAPGKTTLRIKMDQPQGQARTS